MLVSVSLEQIAGKGREIARNKLVACRENLLVVLLLFLLGRDLHLCKLCAEGYEFGGCTE